MREIHFFMSPFSLISYKQFSIVRITRSTTLTLQNMHRELRLTNSSSCCIETVFPAFFLLFMPCIFFPTKTEGKNLNETNIHTRDNQTVSPNPAFTCAFFYHEISNTFLVDLLSAGKSAKFTKFLFHGTMITCQIY